MPAHAFDADKDIASWIAMLEQRHLADFRVPEVTRALRALSSSYVERRGGLKRGAPLDSAGKRAAFAVYYAPLHFLTVRAIVERLGAGEPAPATILDIGCGTGAGGAAWAIAAGRTPRVVGIDRHPWALSEARWTYRHFGLRGEARLGEASQLPPLRPGAAAIAAYTMNELPRESRIRLTDALLRSATGGGRVLVVEPIARSVTPWWDETAARFAPAGARIDEWRFAVELPPLLALFDQAAGLRHRELTARSLYCAGG